MRLSILFIALLIFIPTLCSGQLEIVEDIQGSISSSTNITVVLKIYNPTTQTTSFYFNGERVYISLGERWSETFNSLHPSFHAIGLWKGIVIQYPAFIFIEPGTKAEFSRTGLLSVELDRIEKAVCDGCAFKAGKIIINQRANQLRDLHIILDFGPPLRALGFYLTMIFAVTAILLRIRGKAVE